MVAGRRQTTKFASVVTTTPKPRTPLKGCNLSLLSLKHALAVGHLHGNSSRVPSLVALVSRSPFWRSGCNKPGLWFCSGRTLDRSFEDLETPFLQQFLGIALACLSLRPICWMLPALSLPPQPAELSPWCLFSLPFDSRSDSRWRPMLGLMSRLFAFLAHVQAVQPVAGPFFARWRLASHGDTSPCLLVFRATLLFSLAKLYIYGPNIFIYLNILGYNNFLINIILIF